MNLREAKKLNAGDTFKRPDKNGHCVDGFRRYEVTNNDRTSMGITDEFGYSSVVHWGTKDGSREFLRSAIATKVQQ